MRLHYNPLRPKSLRLSACFATGPPFGSITKAIEGIGSAIFCCTGRVRLWPRPVVDAAVLAEPCAGLAGRLA